MNKSLRALLLFPVFLLASCSTTFTEYRGPDVARGTGGTVRVVEGIDFWENGTPDRSYRILGVIDDRREDGLLFRATRDRHIAAKAKEHGGDAVILMDSSRFPSSVSDSGNINYSVLTKLVVVKYLE